MKTKETAAFIVPHYNDGKDIELDWLIKALDSIKKQTDKDWIIILVDDASSSQKAINLLKQIGSEFLRKMELVFLTENKGPGHARNVAIRKAYQLGCPFVLYLDQDDICHPQRLEVTRRIFYDKPDINVVYSTFQVIDENDHLIPKDKIIPSIREILDQHEKNPPQCKNVWIKIATETGYVNLTSATSVRTNVAYKYPFPAERVSEDYYTWLIYSASGSQYLYSSLIPSKYRIPYSKDGSRSREMLGGQHTFNIVKSVIDTRGLLESLKLAAATGEFTAEELNYIKIKFLLKKSKSMLIDGEKEIAKDFYRRAEEVNKELTYQLKNSIF